MHPDDRTLLRKTHAGHEPSARELWRRHAGWMLAFARTITGDRRGVSADDIVQSVFCRVLALDRSAVRGVRDVRPYLAQSTRREALNQLRAVHRAAQRAAAGGAAREAGGHDGPDSIDSAALALAVSRLPRRLREVVHLRHIAGLSTDETALALGLPRGTVASRTHAAVRSLRDMLAPETTATHTSPTTHAGESRHALAE
ncbi:MAG: sigma-70 family RNA polymerase sigma factor [Phycisphaerales bacterium]|nr:sigma-70 family RNA polymerase sigma factor [Phycisphaerales bacterium]